MTTRNKRSLTEITGDMDSAQTYPSLGEPPSLAATASVDELSYEDLKKTMSELGYELHQKRKQKSAVTQKEEVEGRSGLPFTSRPRSEPPWDTPPWQPGRIYPP